ncbi:MAG: hypothetical protein U0263_01830 [Polyangiaceae bacterium]
MRKLLVRGPDQLPTPFQGSPARTESGGGAFCSPDRVREVHADGGSMALVRKQAEQQEGAQ